MTTAHARSEERDLLREALRRSLGERARHRQFADGGERPGTDRALWDLLTQQVGVSSLLLPVGDGGAGAAVADAAVVLEEAGGALAPVPVLSTLGLVSPVLWHAQTEHGHQLAKRVAAGDTVVALAVTDATAPWAEAIRGDADGVVQGSVRAVLDGAAADVVLVPATMPDGPALVAVDTTERGVTVAPLTTLDLTRGMADLRLDGVQTEPVVSLPQAVQAVEAAVDVGLVLLAAEQVGLAQRCHDEAVAYAGARVQFDRPIGSFQAIKHLLVDLMLDLELGRSAMIEAVDAADAYRCAPSSRSARDLRLAASVAAARCKDMAMRVARETLHVFGGVGFTWEHDAHLYFRRAKTDELLLGDADLHRRRVVAELRN